MITANTTNKTSFLNLLVLLFLALVFLQGCKKKGSEKFLDASGQLKSLPSKVDFNFHIKTILSDRCFTCHGPDENARKGNLRLDTEAGAFAELIKTGGHAIVSGKPSKSKLYNRLISDDPEVQMPPPDSKLSVSPYEIALIEKWIDNGAKWKKHWSFIPPQKNKLPNKQKNAWGNNEIDNFILAKAKQEGLKVSVKATKEKLIRRVTLDLTGLPPSIPEIDAFLADTSETAFEKVVDRLLSTKRYAERIATEWLDVARYADTHGYQGDTERRMWPWRDWVLKAFDENMPYDQFITWQLAGDHLPNPTREQLIATGFNRNHMMNGEGGIIDEEFRVEYVADRTNTTGKAVLGLTMECARCHDHKYDPISQEEYFGLYAFYNNVDEFGMTVNGADVYPYIMMTNEEEDRKIDSLDAVLNTQRNDINKYIAKLEGQKEWKQKVNKNINLNNGLVAHVTFDAISANNKFNNNADAKTPANIIEPPTLTNGPIRKAVLFNGNNEVHLGPAHAFEGNEAFSFSIWLKYPEAVPRGDIIHKLDLNFMGERGYWLYLIDDKISFKLNHAFDNNYIEVVTSESFAFKEWNHLAFTYDGLGKASGMDIYINGKKSDLKIEHDNLFKSTKGYGNLGLGGPSFGGGELDDFRAYNRKLTQPEIIKLSKSDEKPTDWFNYYVHNQDNELRKKRKALRKTLGDRRNTVEFIPQFMIMGDLKDSIRPTHILNRGAYDDLGDEVVAKTPDVVLPFSEDLPKNRMGLAKWLFKEEHPLTSRVMVNRLWQMVFGQGIVSTPDDFGNQGSLPTHPELLDWLAVDFHENNWDIKAMLKKMVMSATYQQTSKFTKDGMVKDKSNNFLARGTRYRLPSEMIRDQSLAISGLLAEKLGGPSVKPYQPHGLWAEKSSNPAFFYVQDHGDSLYRRSLYTYWRRTTPPPNMITFDSPDRNFCAVKREATSTPLQALVLLNDTQFVEAARVFGARMMKEGGEDIEERINYAFRLATSRFPTDAEAKELISLWKASETDFKANKKQIIELLSVGEFPIEDSINQLELASYTVVASAILNLDETITKG